MRDDILGRYRHLRAINKRQQSDALDYVSQTAMLDCARRLGIARGRTLLLDNPDAMTLVYDLCVHAGVGGRSRAIDRYAVRNPPVPESDEAMMLTAARQARFAIFQVQRRHEVFGLYVKDPVQDEQLWLQDESLEATCPVGVFLASRLITIDDFVITCGVMVPVDPLVLGEAVLSLPRGFENAIIEAMQHPRFAIALFRAAIHAGVMDGVRYIDPTEEDLIEAMQAG
jgi:hypothetical protein